MSSFYDKFLYTQIPPIFTYQELSTYTLFQENEINKQWKEASFKQTVAKIFTLGISTFFQSALTNEKELASRIVLFRNKVKIADAAARILQRAVIKKIYQHQAETVAKLSKLGNFRVSGGVYDYVQLFSTWFQEGKLDLTCHQKSQIIWKKATDLATALKKESYYVFFHAHQHSFNTHLELCGQLRSYKKTPVLPSQLPTESLRRFRAENFQTKFKNTTEYLASGLAKLINSGLTTDDAHNKDILSCDVILSNYETYESSQYFFKKNDSILVHSTKNFDFDLRFISDFVYNNYLKKFATTLFQKMRTETEAFSSFGVIRVIAIAKSVLEDTQTNYIWRAHPFGKLCTCQHTNGVFGYQEFIATLQKHQQGDSTKCLTSSYPQYRILTANLDRDPSKMIFVMDCLTPKEKKKYNKKFTSLYLQLEKLLRLEHIWECASMDQLIETLEGIDIKEKSTDYQTGLTQVLRSNSKYLQEALPMIKQQLNKEILGYIESTILL